MSFLMMLIIGLTPSAISGVRWEKWLKFCPPLFGLGLDRDHVPGIRSDPRLELISSGAPTPLPSARSNVRVSSGLVNITAEISRRLGLASVQGFWRAAAGPDGP